MAYNSRSLRITNLYRNRLLTSRDSLQALATQRWPTIDQLDGTNWPERMAASVEQAQIAAVRATAAYISLYLSSETGKRQRGPQIDARALPGLSRDGRPLTESLRSPLIGVKAALKDGKTPEDALKIGLNRAARMVGVDYDAAHRTALSEAIKSDDRFDGSERSTRGTCGACAAFSGTPRMEIHAGCACVEQPRVAGALNRFPLPTGAAIFAAKTAAEQDEMLGPQAADAVRKGTVEITDLVEVSPLATADDFITQKPLIAVT